MKKILFCLCCAFTLLSNAQIKELNGFGKAKIGMTILDFNKIFGTKINNSDQFIGSISKKLIITEEISINNVSYYFENKQLILIKCDFNQQLYNGLEKIYGIEYIKKTLKGKTFFKFKNTSKNIICIGLRNYQIVIYDKNKKPAKKTFRSISFENESIKELNINEGFKGL